MADAALIARLSSNADIAENRLLELKNELEKIKQQKINEKIQELRCENTSLEQKVHKEKLKLVSLETANGKKQYSIPNRTTEVNGNIDQVKLKESTQEQQKAKATEKKVKEKKPDVSKQAVVEAPIDIRRLDLRVGKIIHVNKHPDADSLYVEKVDCGEEKPRTVVSGLVNHVPIEMMRDRMVVILANLKPVKMRGTTSEAMVMCASTPEKVEILSPPQGAVPGDLVHCVGYPREPDAQMNPKKKIFETCAPDLKTNDKMEACYKGSQLVVEGKGVLLAQTLVNAPVK